MPHRERIVRASLAALALACAALPAVFWDGGLIEKESTYFVRQYLDGRTVLEKVFDPHANDIGTYQARELSYFIDLVDAHVLRAALRYDAVFLVPFSGLLGACLTVAIFTVGTARVFPQVPPVRATLILLLYVTNHVYSVTTAVYYRSAKPLLVPVLLTALFYLAGVFKRPGGSSEIRGRILTSGFVATCVLGCVMSLLDRQGFFYAIVMLLVLGLRHRAVHNVRDCLWGAAGAVALMVLYNLVLGPWIVQSVNGYSPSFEYQRVDVYHLMRHPLHFVQAVRLLFENAHLLVGSFPMWLYGTTAAALLAWRWRLRSTTTDVDTRPGPHPGRQVAVLIMASQVVMFAVMIVRHPPIWDWQDHKLWYYPLPYQVLVLFGILLAADRLTLSTGRVRPVVLNVALVVMAAANLLSWPSYRSAMLSSEWFPSVYRQSTALKASLEQRVPSDNLDADYRAFYDFLVSAAPGVPERP
jgi:hypothetical protein